MMIYEQILAILHNHPEGLSCYGILEAAKTQRFNDLTDVTRVSKNVWSLKEQRHWVEECGKAEGKAKLYRINQAGKDMLAQLGYDMAAPIMPTAQDAQAPAKPEQPPTVRAARLKLARWKSRPIEAASGATPAPVAAALPDEINHPAHYNQGGIECIEALKAQATPEEFAGYLKLNCAKYLWRHRHKGGLKDLRKARFYLERLIVETEGTL